MFDELLPYYNSELRFMRELAKEFASAHPKIAGRLRISQDAVEDPHVGRLIEAFAFLNARTRLKLDDDFPEISETLLGLLYPHYLSPLPSMGIVQMTPRTSTSAGRSLVQAGSRVMTEPVAGEPLQYRTGYPVELWPIELSHASLSGTPLVAPPNPRAQAAAGVIRLTLNCLAAEQTFTKLGLDRLRFHLHGESRTAQILYELILGGTVSVAFADNAVDPSAVIVGREAIKAVGLTGEEVLVPLAPAAEPAHALLSEYFAFPEKFLFFDIERIDAKTLLGAGRTLDIFIYLDRCDPALERTINAGDFRLFCTPIINLFTTRADPIRLDPGRYDYRVVPDARRESAIEVYSVDKVSVTDRTGQEQAYRPFFSLGQRQRGRDKVARFWHTTRRASPYAGGGDDVFITMTDEDGQPTADSRHVASIDLTATNRNLPLKLPFGSGRPALHLPEAGSVSTCQCLIAPSRPLRPRRGRGALWRLISHLTLNHLSVGHEEVAADVVKEMLSLYDHADAAASRAVIERLVGVQSTPAVARAPGGGRIAFATGADITLEFEDQRLSGSGTFLLGSVLEAVFASMSAINAFSRTRLRLKGERGVWHAWTARAGTRRLV